MVSREAWRRFLSQGVFPHEFAWFLLLPFRGLILSPRRLIERMGLREDMNVLEVGPGPGYFSVDVARRLRRGTLYLSDIQPEMLEMARRRLDRRGLRNTVYHAGDGRTFPFPDGLFDLVFLVAVLGEVEHQDDYLAEFFRMLKPGGILSVTEMEGDPDHMTLDEVRPLAERHGFRLKETFGDPKTYTANFLRP